MSSDPVKAREWQQRSARAAQERRVVRKRENPRRRAAKKRRNDSEWRAACIAEYGSWCRACGTYEQVEMDHVIPRAQQGRSDVENGLPLCREHHEGKTAGTLRIRPEWLTAPQIEYLLREGWVAWDAQGHPYGRGWKHFESWRWATAEH